VSETYRVLYAEDNSSDSDLAREYFSVHVPDIRLDIVENGASCLSLLQQQPYDGLLLDNHLPDMDASDVLTKLATQKITIPVVVATSVGDEELVVRLLRLGAWDYIPKQDDYIARLPVVVRRAVAEHRRRRDVAHPAHRGQRRILYIERHAADVDLTARQLSEQAPHLRLEVVGSSREALQRLHDTSFDAVLTDLRMPDMNALDFLREVRSRALPVPVVIVTGRGDEETAVAALKLGAYDYIVKRDDYVTQLPYALDNAIDRFHLTQTNQRPRDGARGPRTCGIGARTSDRAAATRAEDRLPRAAGGRRRSRLQQSPDRDHRSCRPDQAAARKRRSAQRQRERDPLGGGTRHRADATAPGVQPTAAAAAARPRSERLDSRELEDAAGACSAKTSSCRPCLPRSWDESKPIRASSIRCS
jgi:DNA-binding NtrC family response regulator